MRALRLDNGGQGWSNTVMANQSHDRGEPPKLDNDTQPSREAVGEPKCPASSGEDRFYSVGCNRTTVWSGGSLA